MDRSTAEFIAQFLRAYDRINQEDFRPLAKRIVQSTSFFCSFYTMVDELQISWLRKIWKEEIPRASKLELAEKLADQSIHNLCDDLEKLVENQLVPSGMCEVIDTWSGFLSESIDSGSNKDSSETPWYENSNKRFCLTQKALEEFRTVDFHHRITSLKFNGGSRLELLTGAELVRTSLTKLSNPTPETRNRIKKWKLGSLGALIFSIGVGEIVLDISTFEPLHSGFSIAGGIASVGHGGHLFWHSIAKHKLRAGA